jgi:Protein of unknown function (DUF3800)
VSEFTAYFDDSGSPDEGICLGVAGFVSTNAKWTVFEDAWQSALRQYDIEYFHMREYAHSVGQFKNWKGKDGKRKTFLRKLIQCLNGRVHKSFASSVVLKDYNDVDALYPLHEALGYPLALCGRTCSARINNWRKNRKISEPVELIFEAGSKHARDLERIQKRDKQPVPQFVDKKRYGALQAADFVAWENTKALTDLERGKISGLDDIRKSLAALNRIPNHWGVYDREDLIASCDLVRLPLRSAISTMTPEMIKMWNDDANKAAIRLASEEERDSIVVERGPVPS